ncbi:glycoside hydrolase family protein [Paraburkholderia diazotrophica]|uniref:Lysozyme n=1 Tax=Paraburkholderia diazotrophica TaxID=667676 RepID=A0A1H6QTV7_9BURK|nr:glycoside hydrolase family protein [Paraburkholderia diazotrophica]SEI42900.1 lysozyme [Paraburkholderia diazotrophica]
MILSLLDAELRRDEGVRYVPYLDTADPPKRTIGVGHNMDVSPPPAGWTFPLNDAQVNQLLDRDVSTTLAKLDKYLPWWRQMDEVRQRVIANMCFNLGIGNAALGTGLLGFKNTLAAMQRGSYGVAAAGMKASKWYGQVGQRGARLCKAMETGVMPT